MASPPEEKMSKKARQAAARQRAAAFAARDKAKVDSARAAKSGAPVTKVAPKTKAPKTKAPKKAASATIAKTTQAKPKSPDKKMSVSERRKIARENAKNYTARSKASKKAAAAEVDDIPSPAPEILPSQQDFGAIDRKQVEEFEEMQKRLNSDDNEEIDEDYIAPPPALMKQVSTQVLLNVRKAEEEEMEDIDVTSVDGSDEIVEAEPPKPLSKLSILIVITVILLPAIAILSMMIVLPVPQMDPTRWFGEKFTSPKDPVCYLDSIPNPDPEAEVSCSNMDGAPCPKGGVCEGGKLIACDNKFQDVSVQGHKCGLGEDYVPMRDALIDLLVSKTSAICDHSQMPLFKYSELQKDQPVILEEESVDLVEALADEGFVMKELHDGVFAGLPEGYEVSRPLYCHAGNLAQSLLEKFGLLLLGALGFVWSFAFGLASTYPMPTAVIGSVVVLVAYVHKYRAAKKKLQDEFIRTRDITYERLGESAGTQHFAIHIRDEVASGLYPDDKKLNLNFKQNVWPKIVNDVKRDSRIRKFQGINEDGKRRDMWQWVAASKSASKS